VGLFKKYLYEALREDDMRANIGIRYLFFLLLIGLPLTACASPTEAVPAPQPSTQTARPISTPVPAPTRTPAPTARPLLEETTEEGVYQQAKMGVSFAYPKEWEVEVTDDNGFEFVIVQGSKDPVVVFLEPGVLAEGVDFEVLAEEHFGWLQDNLGLTSVTWATSDPSYVLADGENAWRGTGEGLLESQTEPILFVFESISAQRGNFIFHLIIFASSDWVTASETILEDIRQSFRVFSPRPYGVARDQALFLSADEPTTLDPAKWHGGPNSIMGDLFSGLVKLDNGLQVIPDLAENWTVSPDGRVYTFILRQGVVFHNGRPFTAQDVKYSWERACDPNTGSDTAETYLGDIQGVAQVISGDVKEISGVKVLDDFTLEVSLDEPKAYFPYKLAYVTSWIVDRETVGEIENAPNGTGPFKLARHDEEELIILARNENYYRGYVQLEYVVYLIYQGPSIRLYESGDIDLVYVNEDLIERAEDPQDPLFGNVQPVAELCTSYVVYDVTQAPFDELVVREAFTKAIDKDRFNDVVEEGKGVIANGLYPPGLPGYNPNVQPIPFNPAEARASLAASSYGGPDGLPEIVLTISGEGGDLYPDDAILLQMWEEVLGVSIVVEQIDYESYFDEIFAGNHGQLLSTGWCADYPDPENFADLLFHSGGEQNLSGYNKPELDTMLEAARNMTNVEARLALYQEIEQLIVDEMPAAFLKHSSPYYLITKPYVRGFMTNPIGVAQLMNVSIVQDE
jgi:oligopeptide transport system substrate-binding protein